MLPLPDLLTSFIFTFSPFRLHIRLSLLFIPSLRSYKQLSRHHTCLAREAFAGKLVYKINRMVLTTFTVG